MYSIIELQTNDGQTAHIYFTASTRNEAMSKFHQVMAAASISQVEYHTCVVMDEKGQYLARECYEHKKAEISSDSE